MIERAKCSLFVSRVHQGCVVLLRACRLGLVSLFSLLVRLEWCGGSFAWLATAIVSGWFICWLVAFRDLWLGHLFVIKNLSFMNIPENGSRLFWRRPTVVAVRMY